MSSFEIHNLEGNQMYFKNIGLHLAYLSNKLKKKLFLKKINFCKIVIQEL